VTENTRCRSGASWVCAIPRATPASGWECECSDVTYEPVLTESCTLRNGHCELPAPKDGGAEASAVPQAISGMADSENATSPPVRIIDSGRNV
jgi:hypothetical protein